MSGHVSSLGRIRTRTAGVGLSVFSILTLAAAFGDAGCGRSNQPGPNMEQRLAELARANRMVIERIRDGRTERLEETRDTTKIASAVRFFRRYPDRWLQSTGIFGDYLMLLYDDDRFIGRLGLTAIKAPPGEVTLSVDDYFRRVPAADVVDLARQLNVPWPPR